MDILDIVNHGFIQRALIAGSFIAILCSTLGTFLVLRRLSLIGDGLAHVTFGSVALGLFLRVYPLYTAIPVVLLSSLGILKLTERARLYGDAAIGIMSSMGIALGILLASVAGGFNIDLFSYLFGNILAISSAEVVASIVLSFALLAVVFLFYHELIAVTFDEESARTSGVRTRTINTILVLLTALTVVLAMRVVGILLISALLILPAVTALQMLQVLCTIANDGVSMKPFIVRRVTAPDGQILFEQQPKAIGQPIRTETAKEMQRLLARVTEEGGTGFKARVEGYSVAGKTGTAQKAIPGGYSDTLNMSSFTGFIPVEDPQLAIIVVLDEPKGSFRTGGVVAGPVFREIAEQVVRYLDMPPSTTVVAGEKIKEKISDI